MEIIAHRHNLVEALEVAIKAASTNTTIPLLQGFLLEAKANYCLKITANDTEMAIRYTTDCTVIKSGSTVVEAKLFLDIIKKMSENEIHITLNENETLKIKSGKTVMNIPALKPDGFPIIDDYNKSSQIELDQTLVREMISKVAYCAYQMNDRPGMKGILINIDNGKMDFVTMDGARLALRTTVSDIKKFKAVIPTKSATEIAKAMKAGTVKIFENKKIIAFETENFVITARLLDESFIAYQSLIENCKEHTLTVIVETKELQTSLERISLFNDNTPLEIRIDECFDLSFKSSSGQLEDKIRAKIEGSPIRILFDYRKLIESLKNIEDKEIKILFRNNLFPIVIIPIEGDKFFNMIGPVNPNVTR